MQKHLTTQPLFPMNPNKKMFKITLTPMEQFFFGGETVFGGDGGQSDRRRSYLVKSNLLPQQTSLLGLLREQILKQNDLLLDSKSDAEKIQQAIKAVGATGFAIDAVPSSYGLIHKISPVAIQDQHNAIWQPAPLDDREMNNQPLRFEVDENSHKPVLRNLDPKINLSTQFGTGKERRELDNFFTASVQVGITMTNRVHQMDWTDDDLKEAFYRQTFQKNGNSAYKIAASGTQEVSKNEIFSFVFWVKMDDDIVNFQFHDALVNLGGERSIFKMQVEPDPDNQELEACFPQVQYMHETFSAETAKKYKRILLLSDCYADWEVIRQHSELVVSHTVPFRYFSTVLGKTARYFDFKNTVTTKQQSDLYTLLQRGGVIYCTEEGCQKITSHIESFKTFQNIGYNYFQTL